MMEEEYYEPCDVCEENVQVDMDGELILECNCLSCPFGFNVEDREEELNFNQLVRQGKEIKIRGECDE